MSDKICGMMATGFGGFILGAMLATGTHMASKAQWERDQESLRQRTNELQLENNIYRRAIWFENKRLEQEAKP